MGLLVIEQVGHTRGIEWRIVGVCLCQPETRAVPVCSVSSRVSIIICRIVANISWYICYRVLDMLRYHKFTIGSAWYVSMCAFSILCVHMCMCVYMCARACVCVTITPLLYCSFFIQGQQSMVTLKKRNTSSTYTSQSESSTYKQPIRIKLLDILHFTISHLMGSTLLFCY